MLASNRAAQRLVSEPEQHADALRRRERDVEPGHAPDVRRDQLASRSRIVSLKCARQRISVDLADDPDVLASEPEPVSGRLGPLDVVVLHPAPDAGRAVHPCLRLLEVVALLADGELAYGDHATPGRQRCGSGNRAPRCNCVPGILSSSESLASSALVGAVGRSWLGCALGSSIKSTREVAQWPNGSSERTSWSATSRTSRAGFAPRCPRCRQW